MASHSFVLFEEQINEINAALLRMIKKAEAKCALLVDKDGHLITRQGFTHSLDTTALAALLAGSFASTKEIARLVGEREEPGGRGAGRPAADAVRVAVHALVDAADDDSATGGPDSTRRIWPVVATVTAAGYLRVPDADLWRFRAECRRQLVGYVRQKLSLQVEMSGGMPQEVEQARTVFNPDALTLGFARRFATYKRAHLIFRDIDRIARQVAGRGMPSRRRDLSPSVLKHIPTRINDDDRYFEDQFQFMPTPGYAEMFGAILDHPLITVRLGAYHDDYGYRNWKHTVFTGPVDEYFGHQLGRLCCHPFP